MNAARAWLTATVLTVALTACERAAPQAAPAAAPAPATPAAVATPAAPPPAAATASADFVLPGDFAPDTTLEQLRQRYGAGNVQAGKVPGAEGEEFDGAILFADDPKRRAYLYFQDEAQRRGLSLIRVFEPESAWTLDNGVRMGQPLSELVALNGKPISYYGLEWDYGGTVVDYHGGRLERQDEQIGRALRLGLRDNGDQGVPDQATPVGEGTYRSDDPKYPEQGRWVVVSELLVSFPGEDDL